MSFNIFIVLLSLVLVFGCIGIWKLIRFLIVRPIKIVGGRLADASAERRILSSSYGKAYEEMCIYNILKYEGDPRVPEVIENYWKFILGEILDRGMKNAPSEKIKEMHRGYEVEVPNPDYVTYLKNQIKAFKVAGESCEVFEHEYKRVRKTAKESDIKMDFTMKLVEMGLSLKYGMILVTDKSIQKYRPEDWSGIIGAVKAYDVAYGYPCTSAFLENVEEINILTDDCKIKAFKELTELGVSNDLAGAFVQGKIGEEDLREVLGYLENGELTSVEALQLLLEKKNATLKVRDLKSQYRQAVNP
jgi:hypothetical protein